MNTTAIALRDPWATLPSLGNLDAYIRAVNQLPTLTAQEETACALRLRDQQDLEAAGRLVLSHLRLVVAIARQYIGYGLPHGDLIQEGNIGLMKAVKKFDPEQGVRLVSYAIHWIKAEIHEYVLRNWRMVKVATTKAQRKLFFNLRSLKNSLKNEHTHEQSYRQYLSQAEVQAVAQQLQVRPEEVLEMEARLSGNDIALEPGNSDADHEPALAPAAYLADESTEPTKRIESQYHDRLSSIGIESALATLDLRSRRIVEERWLKVQDDGSGGMTLHELASEYGISAERVRQIEVAAMKKMRQVLAEFA